MTDTNDNMGDTNMVSIPIGKGEFKSVDTELLSQYLGEAFESLEKLDEFKAALKSTVTTTAEVTGLKKGIVSKFFKARYEDKIKEASDLSKTLNALNDAV